MAINKRSIKKSKTKPSLLNRFPSPKFLFVAGIIGATTLIMTVFKDSLPSFAATQPQVSISNASTLEGKSGTHVLDFNVTLSAPSTQSVTVTYTTSNDWTPYGIGTATGAFKATDANADYVVPVLSKTLTFNPGQVVKTISIPIVGDTRVEGNENFTVVLANVQGATMSDGYGSGTIIDDDQVAGFSLGIGDVSIREGNTKNRTVQLVVGFSDAAPAAFSLTTSTQSGTATGVATASIKAGDYVAQTKTINVAKGARFKIITITLMPDTTDKGNENFTVNLTSTLGTVTKPIGTVTIRDDDTPYARLGRQPGAPRVALVGDSLTAGYENTAKAALESLGYAVSEHGEPGSGILDANKCTGQQATSIVNGEDPDIIIYENTANYGWFTPCDSSVAYVSPAFFAAWQVAAQQDTNILTSKGAQLYWILNPSTTPGPRHDAIPQVNQIYSNIAASTANTHTIDAFAPFGGDPPNCAAYRVADCLHFSQPGNQLMTNLVTAVVH